LDIVEIQPWQVIRSDTAFTSPWLTVRKDVVHTNRDTVTDYYVVERFDYVVIVALTEEQQVLTVRQYKHGVGRIIRELPAGYIEQGEEPLLCAHRELREETGYEAQQMVPLGVFAASPSASCHRAHIFLATGLRLAGEQMLDANEKIAVEPMDLAAAVEALTANRDLADLSSTTALLLTWNRVTNRDEAKAAKK